MAERNVEPEATGTIVKGPDGAPLVVSVASVVFGSGVSLIQAAADLDPAAPTVKLPF